MESDDIETLRAHIKYLERENKMLRQTLLDDFAKAAMFSISESNKQTLSYIEIAENCYLLAEAMLYVKHKRENL